MSEASPYALTPPKVFAHSLLLSVKPDLIVGLTPLHPTSASIITPPKLAGKMNIHSEVLKIITRKQTMVFAVVNKGIGRLPPDT
jgi:hypothetical protein